MSNNFIVLNETGHILQGYDAPGKTMGCEPIWLDPKKACEEDIVIIFDNYASLNKVLKDLKAIGLVVCFCSVNLGELQ
jgi:hypothetical protein